MTHTHLSADIADALQDLKTHREVWRSALLKQQTPFGSDDDGSYWAHELKVFDRTFSALEKLVLSEPQQVKVTEALEEWRMARQDVFDNTTKISEENVARWKRLSDAEHSLMDVARAASSPLTRPQSKGDQ